MLARFLLLLLLAFSAFGAEGAGGGGNTGTQIPYPGVGTLSSGSPITLPGFYNIGAMSQTFTRATSSYDPVGNTIVAPGVVRTRTINVCGKGFPAYLIEGSATNLLAVGSSETWTGNSPQGATQGSNTTVYSPDPTQLMNLLVESAATSPHYLTQTFSITGTVASYQIILKPYGGLQYVMIREGSQTGDAACYDLVNGVVNSTASCTATCTAIGNGLFRCTISITNCATGTLHFDTTTLQSPTTTWASASYAGDTTKGFYWWGQMAEASAFPTSYVSNRNLYSLSEKLASWTLQRSTATNATTANPLNGAQTACTLTEDTTASANHNASQVVTKPASSGTYTTTVYVKRGSGTRHFRILCGFNSNTVYAYFDLGAGTVAGAYTSGTGWANVSQTITSVGGFWKIVFTYTTDTNSAIQIYLFLSSGTSVGSEVYTGDGVSSLILYGQQTEPGSSSTAYWATDSAPGVRDADNLSVSLAGLPGGGLSTSQGTLLGVAIPYGWNGNDGTNAWLCDDASSNGYTSLLSSSAQAVKRKDSVGVQFANPGSGTPSQGVIYNLGMTWNASQIVGFFNGNAGTPTTCTPPYSLSTALHVGAASYNTEQLNGWVSLLYWHNRVLTARQLITLYQRSKLY